MSPYHAALQQGLQNYGNIVENAYAPLLKQAEVNSKNAYADNLSNQIVGSILSNPLAVGMMSDATFDELMRRFTKGRQSSTQNTASSGFPSFGGGSSQPSQSSSQGSGVVIPSAKGSDANNYEYDAQGNNVRGTEADINNAAGLNPDGTPRTDTSTPSNAAPTSTPSSNYNQRQMIKDAYIAKNFPGTPQGLAAEQRISAAKTAGTAGAQTYQDHMNAVYKQASAANQARQYSDDFLTHYKAAWAKGPLTNLPIGKQLAAFDPEAVSAMNDSNNMVVVAAPALLGTGKQTDYGKHLVADSKLYIGMPEKAAQDVHDKQVLIFDRMAEEVPFNVEAKKYGITDTNQLQSDWFEYNSKYKLINNEGKLQSKNANKYSQFLANKYGNGSQNQNNSEPQRDFGDKKILRWNHKTGRLE